MRYAPEKVVALLDTERAGEIEHGFPVVGTVNDALCFNPNTALVGVATAGGRFPPAFREQIRSCIAKGLDVENGLHEFLTADAELVELARKHNVELRDLRKPPPDLNVTTGENLEVPARIVLTVGSDCAIGKMTVAIELDREARRRGIASEFVPTGQTGIAIAGLGHRGRRRRRRLHRRRVRAPRRRGSPPRRRAADRRGTGLAPASPVLGRHARPLSRIRTARARPLPLRRPAIRRGRRALPDPAAARARRAPRADGADREAGAGRLHRAEHAGARRGRRAARDRRR